MIVRVKNREVATLNTLTRLVLWYIYDEKTMPLDKIHLMQDSIVQWPKKAFLSSVESEVLGKLGKLLMENEQGKLKKRKWLFKDRGIDYRKFHRLPEAYTKSDFARGDRIRKENELRNPEEA